MGKFVEDNVESYAENPTVLVVPSMDSGTGGVRHSTIESCLLERKNGLLCGVTYELM